jgi:predicted MFS family arabinose efflux permease
MLTFGTIAGLERMGLPVLFKEISASLNLSLVSIGTVWGMDPLAGIFVSLLGGLLVDRFGIKRTLTVACILAALFCALRGFSSNFMSMAATMFLFGLMAAMVPTVTFKTTIVWFSGKNLALANVLINIAGAVGSMLATMLSATVLSPWLGGWRNVLFVLAIPAAILGILWLTTGKEPVTDKRPDSQDRVSFLEAISRVAHLKEIWIIGLIEAAFMGATMGMSGYLPLYLRNIGWAPARADLAITIISAAIMIGAVPMIIVSNRLKAPRGVLFFSIAVLAAGLAIQPFISRNEAGVYVLLALTSFLRSGAIALFNTLIYQIKGVGSDFGGTALGLAQAMAMVFAFAAPPLGNSLSNIDPGAPFIFWAVLPALSLPLFLLLKKIQKV